jgi:hypothetical protein
MRNDVTVTIFGGTRNCNELTVTIFGGERNGSDVTVTIFIYSVTGTMKQLLSLLQKTGFDSYLICKCSGNQDKVHCRLNYYIFSKASHLFFSPE